MGGDLLPAERATLARLAEQIAPRQELTLAVEGRFDPQADLAALATARSASILAALTSSGLVDAARVSASEPAPVTRRQAALSALPRPRAVKPRLDMTSSHPHNRSHLTSIGPVPASEGFERPGVADGVEHLLDPRVIPLQQVAGWIFAAFVAAGSFVVLIITWLASGPRYPLGGLLPVTGLPPLVADLLVRLALWTIGIGLLVWHAHRWPAIEYRHTSYRVDALGIEIRRGVFWRTVTNVPRSRVQHTDVSQGPLERRWELGTLVIFTAGTDHAKVSLPGLEHSIALRIREHLLPTGESDAV